MDIATVANSDSRGSAAYHPVAFMRLGRGRISVELSTQFGPPIGRLDRRRTIVRSKNDGSAQGGGAMALPCSRVEDLYSAVSRQTLGRLLGDWLRRHTLTVTEFIHSAAALDKFESAGTAYQHAIQKIAVTVAGRSKTPVVEVIKALNALTSAAVQRVYADERRGLFPSLSAEAMLELASRLESDPRGRYVLSGTMAKYLGGAETWDSKLLRMIAVWELEIEDGGGRVLATSLTESLAAELLDDRNVLVELLGPGLDFADQLGTAIRIFKGQASEGAGPAESLNRLAGHFAAGHLPDARAAIANFILSECKSPKRLSPLSLDDELKAFRALAADLSNMEEGYFDPIEVSSILAERSGRFITPEALAHFLAAASAPDDRLDRLLILEANIEGSANKRALSPFAISVLSGQNLDDEFAAGAPGVQRLRRASDLQTRILRSGLQDAQRDKLAGILDAIAVRIENQGRYIAGLEVRLPDPAERVETYLKFFEAGVFTEGNLAGKARRAVLAAIADPDFLARYTSKSDRPYQTLLLELVDQLKRIGISPEESVHALTPG